VSASIRLKLCLICLLGLFLYAAARCQAQQPQPAQTNSTSATKNAQAPANESEEGEKLFRTNCGRCHNPPEDLSPREARVVLRQMRVRAMLSAEDERLILKYIAP